MEDVLLIIYILMLLLALAYGGVIVYHILKYRHQLPDKDARQAIVVMVGYLIVGGGVLVLSIVIASVTGLLRLIIV